MVSVGLIGFMTVLVLVLLLNKFNRPALDDSSRSEQLGDRNGFVSASDRPSGPPRPAASRLDPQRVAEGHPLQSENVAAAAFLAALPKVPPPQAPPPPKAGGPSIAVVFKTMLPIKKETVAKLLRLQKDLAGSPQYQLVLMADTTNLKGKPAEPLPEVDDSVIRFFFNEPEFLVAYPEVDSLWNHFNWTSNEGEKKHGYKCCNKVLLWQFQNVIINFWLSKFPTQPHPFEHVWMMQDDVGGYHEGMHVEVAEMQRIDRERKEDLVGFDFVRQCPQNGCPGWGGSWAKTPEFTALMTRMRGDRVRYQCYSDGLQRLSRAMMTAYDEAIHKYTWRFGEGMVMPIAYGAGLKWWTYAPPEGSLASILPPCRRKLDKDHLAASKDSWIWGHQEDITRR